MLNASAIRWLVSEHDTPPIARPSPGAAEYARGEGRFDEMHEALFRNLVEAEGHRQKEVLVKIGASVGLEREGLRFALEEGSYTEKVLADEELARRLDVGSVPTMFVGLPASRSTKKQAYSNRVCFRRIQNVGDYSVNLHHVAGDCGP